MTNICHQKILDYISIEMNDKICYAKICPYCEEKPEYVNSITVYGTSYGMIYLCRGCDAYVGVHKGSDRPLGRLANKELREAKKKAHFYFDSLWKAKIQIGIRNQSKLKKGKGYAIWRSKCRTSAYRWLSKTMNIDFKYTHIGMFNIEQCNKVVELCTPLYQKIYEK